MAILTFNNFEYYQVNHYQYRYNTIFPMIEEANLWLNKNYIYSIYLQIIEDSQALYVLRNKYISTHLESIKYYSKRILEDPQLDKVYNWNISNCFRRIEGKISIVTDRLSNVECMRILLNLLGSISAGANINIFNIVRFSLIKPLNKFKIDNFNENYYELQYLDYILDNGINLCDVLSIWNIDCKNNLELADIINRCENIKLRLYCLILLWLNGGEQ